MKITKTNYFREIKKIKISSLPKDFQNAHKVFRESTENGKDWELFNGDKEIQSMIKMYLVKLNKHLEKKPRTNKPSKPRAKPKEKTQESAKTERKKETKTTKPKPVTTTRKPKKVAKVDEEIELIKQFVGMLGKHKNKKQILSLLKKIQKYLFERRARRVYKYAKELEEIEQVLFKAFQKQGDLVLIKVSKVKEKHYREIAGSEEQRIAISFIKSYLNLQGQNITKEKVKSLFNRIADAVNNNKLTKRNRHWKYIDRILDSLKSYYNKEILTIHSTELRGLQGIVDKDGGQKKK